MTRFRTAAFVAALVWLPAAAAMARGFDDFRAATPEELAMKGVPSAPGAAAVILDWGQRVDDIDLDSSEYVRIKILTEAGRKYGDIEIPYAPEYYHLHRIEARMTRPDGTIVDFKGKIYEKLIVKAGGKRLVSENFSIPDVQPGSIIEYKYRLGGRGQYLHNTRFVVQQDLPVLRAFLWLRPYQKEFTSFFTFQGLPEGKKPEKIGDHYELALENVPAFEKERYAPPEGELKTRVDFFYIEGRLIQSDAFWIGEGKSWTKKVESFIGSRPYVADQARAAIGTAATPDEKLHKLYARAQQIRNLAYEDEKTDAEAKNTHDNKSADDVLLNGYGSPSEINRTFVALARAAGFEANAVRIGESDERIFSKALPIGEHLDGEVAVVSMDGKQVWIDAGTPGAPYRVLSWQKLHVPGMLLSKGAAASWLMTPEQPASDALTQRKAVLRIEDDSIKGKITLTLTGQEALRQRVKNYKDDEAAIRKSLEETGKEWFAGGAVVKVTNVSGMKSIDDPIVVDFDVELSSLGSFAGSRALIPMSVFQAAAKNPFAPAQRKHPILFPYAWSEADDVTLQFPGDYSVESLPQPIKYDVNAAIYQSHYEASGANTVHFTRKFEFRSLYFGQESYGALRNFFSKVATADQDQLVLHKRAKTAAQ